MSLLRVRYFASLRETLGVADEEIPVDAGGVTVDDVLGLLAEAHGEAAAEALTAPGVRLAVNDELVDGVPGRLHAGDVLAFLPPVTGG
jgi:molybdopterin synthase sulfur carrier subunit